MSGYLCFLSWHAPRYECPSFGESYLLSICRLGITAFELNLSEDSPHFRRVARRSGKCGFLSRGSNDEGLSTMRYTLFRISTEKLLIWVEHAVQWTAETFTVYSKELLPSPRIGPRDTLKTAHLGRKYLGARTACPRS